MIYTLQGEIEVLKSKQKIYIDFGIQKQDLLLMLCYLTALEYKKIGCFRVKNGQIWIKFTFDSQMLFDIDADDTILSGTFKKEQVELIKCCCIDNSLWGGYNHVDFEHELCDFTFRIIGQ